jgi:RHS repeat-associated protein
LIDRSPTNTIINCWKYHSTGAGQRTWVEEFDHRTAWYTYDNLGRLKTETVTGSIQDGKNGTVTYGYDNVGNRLTRNSSLSGVTNQALGYDANDRLNGDQYDANGNTRNAPVSQPSTLNSQQLLGTDDYDSENRLTQRTGTNGSAVRLVYDGDGNRVQEIVGGQTKSYLIDDRNPTGYAQVVEEIVNGSGNHTYTYGHDLISQDQVDPLSNTWHATFYAYDGHGNVRFLTNESGQVTDTYVYDAFGTLITATGTTTNRYLYTGEQFDPNLGLYYLRARLMNPLTGRFWSMDTYLGLRDDPQSIHKYLYAASDPSNKLDPSGKLSLSEVAVAAGISGTFSALDAYVGRNGNISGQDLLQEFATGATVGAVVGSLGLPARVLGVVIAATGGWAIGDAINHGQYNLALFRALSLGLSGSIFSRFDVPSAPPSAAQLEFSFSNNLTPPVGTRVYRVWGPVEGDAGVLEGSGAWGRSWTTVDPRTTPGFRQAAGLPNENGGRFISEGVLEDVSGVTLRQALPGPDGRGGTIPEVLIPEAEFKINLLRVEGINPSF